MSEDDHEVAPGNGRIYPEFEMRPHFTCECKSAFFKDIPGLLHVLAHEQPSQYQGECVLLKVTMCELFC